MISKFKKINKRGFTLVEMLMAVFVLTYAIAGPLTIASKGVQTATIAKDQDTALYLAQDAIEYVRWARDTNQLNNLNWLNGGSISGSNSTVLTPCVSADGSATCYLDSLAQNPTAPTACPAGICPVMNFTSANTYAYNTGTPTIFTRTVSIQIPIGANDDCTPGHDCEAKVVAKVSWCDQTTVCAVLPGSARSVTLIDDLFAWH
jgi:prepilin-type N-terminal cleavage/methylation domain-containing protein